MVVEQVDIPGFGELAKIKKETDEITEENEKNAAAYLSDIRNHCEGLSQSEMPYVPIIGLNGIVLKWRLPATETEVAGKGKNFLGHYVVLLEKGFFRIDEYVDKPHTTRLVEHTGSADVGRDTIGYFIEKTPPPVGKNPPGGSTIIRLETPAENQVTEALNGSFRMAIEPLQRRNDMAKQGRTNINAVHNFISSPIVKK